MALEPAAAEIHAHLLELQAERALASIEGLAANSAVTELAALRAELCGPQAG
jgi:hypothetical protein